MKAKHQPFVDHFHEQPNYIGIFVILAILTVVEVIIAYIAGMLITVALVVMSAAKAALVALYYMHLKFEGRLIYAAALTPLVLAVLMIFAINIDINAAQFSKNIVEYSAQPGAAHGAEAHAPAAHAPQPAQPRVVTTTTTTTTTTVSPPAQQQAQPTQATAPTAAPGTTTIQYFDGAPQQDWIYTNREFYE